MCMDTGAALGAPRAARPRARQRQRWAHHQWRRHRRSGGARASGAHAVQRQWRGALHLVRLFLLSLHYGYLYLLWLYYGYTYYGEVRYTEYLGADGNAHTASIWWALSDPALGAWAFGGGGGGGRGGRGGAPPSPATAAAAELQLELRQLTRIARRVEYNDPTVGLVLTLALLTMPVLTMAGSWATATRRWRGGAATACLPTSAASREARGASRASRASGAAGTSNAASRGCATRRRLVHLRLYGPASFRKGGVYFILRIFGSYFTLFLR